MNEAVKELVAIGASVGAHCQPCLEHHIRAATRLGISPEDIHQAITIGHTVEKGAMVAMRKFSAAAEDGLRDPTGALSSGVTDSVDKAVSATPGKILKVFDPAMCCATGVCGPSVDPNLARFAGTLSELANRPGLTIERFNLGQQPQAFAEDAEVRSLLANGGEQRLPFIFIDGRLQFQGRYPTREELLASLGLTANPDPAFPQAASNPGACCSGDADDGGCCS